jgi:hypothetical protein
MLSPAEMRDRINELSRQDGFINGIYNYCDKWCEKCTFTSKCRNYAFGKEVPAPGSQELFTYLQNIFEATNTILNELIEKMGIDPEEAGISEPLNIVNPKNHPLSKETQNLSLVMHDWITKNKPDEERNNTSENKHLKESVEQITTYSFLITDKINRALLGLNEEWGQEIQTDSNGSAKIALIALDKLINSWSVILVNKLDHQDDLLQILIRLSEIRRQTEEIFPNARDFVRPGFDEPQHQLIMT